MDTANQWQDAYLLLDDFIEELNVNSYGQMETSFRFRDKYLELKDTYNGNLDLELVELFDFIRFSLSTCSSITMATRLLSEGAILAGLRRII